MAGSIHNSFNEVHRMDIYIFELVDNSGYFYCSIDTAPTNLSKDDYFNKHIRSILPELAKSHNVEKLLWDSRG